METILKQANQAEEAIEAIRSFRDCCPNEAQESLDNILLGLYKGTHGHEVAAATKAISTWGCGGDDNIDIDTGLRRR
uniref:Uncharacterized protein n=1 Tax=Aegilops tauschii subsp. strangulata TaxID=200361 RepID=A0A453EN94_AEGTS